MEPLLATVALTIYLLPCAIQDWRSHQISNWLTIPAFLIAWVAAFTLDHLLLTMAVFLGCYAAWLLRWMGAADGKLLTLVAAVAPSTLVIGVMLLGFTFLLLRLLRNQQTHLPAATWLWLASILNATVVSAQVPPNQLLYMWWLVTLPQFFAMGTGLLASAFLFAELRTLATSFLTKQRPTRPR